MQSDSIILVLASLGLAQGLFLSIYLLTLKKGDRKANVFLGLILLGITIRIGKSVLNYYIPLEMWQNSIGVSGIFIAAPALWFYGKVLIKKDKPFHKINYLHFFPFILFLALIPFIPKIEQFENFWNYGLFIIVLFIYLIICWSFLFKNRSKASASIFYWYRNILIGASLIWLHYVSISFGFAPYYLTGPIFYTFLIYAFTFLFLNRHKFTLQKYSSSTLDQTTSRHLFQKIKALFEVDHLFLDEGITLSTVSQKLNIKARDVSQAINENKQQNFNEFVNHYRIQKAKALLKDSNYKDEKVATIAYESGFANVTSFNVAFKKETGLTPSAYRKL